MNLRLLQLPILILTICLMACQSSSEPKLHLLVWGDYIKPELIKKFQQEHQCRIVIDTFDSNEAMYAKLKLGSERYDLIFPSNYFLDLMNDQEMLLALDKSKIINIDNLDPNYIKRIPSNLSTIGIPYMVTSAGIAYRTDKVTNLEESWGVFGSSKYKGRMTMLNDVRETIGAALLFLGYSANTLNQQEVDEAIKLLLNWKQNLAKFESEQYKSGLSSAEYLIVNGYNGDILQVIKENPHINFFYPKEGITFTIDFMVIPKEARNVALAYQFINYLLDPIIAAENMEFTSFLSPNHAAYNFLPRQLRDNPTLFIPSHVLDKAELIRYLGEDGVIYNKAWDKIKLG